MATYSKISGCNAIAYAEAKGILLHKYNDPIEDARDVTPEEARKIIAEDPALIYLEFRGWTEGDGTGHEGYSVGDYFSDGYLGPDAHGIEPIYA